jgi:hypothetical protein
MTTRHASAALFGISHIKGIVDAFKGVEDFTQANLEIPPWQTGSFKVNEGIHFSYVAGWWDEKTTGKMPSFNKDGIIEYPQALARLAATLPRGAHDPVFFQLAAIDGYAGAELINLGPYDIDPKWDFSTDGQPVMPGRCPVRKKDVDDFIRKTTQNILASCVICKALFPETKIYYVFPPPPIESEAYIIEKARAVAHGHESYQQRYALILKYGIRPFAIRHKLMELANEQLKQDLKQFDIGYITAPDECLLPSGALNERYASDMHHGNHLYNEAVMRKITATIGSLPLQSDITA